MKSIALFMTLAAFTQIAHAEIVTGEEYTYALLDGMRCDITKIPNAAQAAVDAAINNTKKTCANPDILSARVLSVEPTACRTWNAGFRAKAEVEFACATNVEQAYKTKLNSDPCGCEGLQGQWGYDACKKSCHPH